MIINATEEMVIEAACKAIAASLPMGMGILHYSDSDDIPNQKEVATYLDRSGMYIDYYHGRMVKFGINREGERSWSFSDSIDREYQSWARKYDGYLDLFTSID